VSQERDVDRLTAETLKAYGRADVLVNNAGLITARAPIHQVKVTDWDAVMAVNLRGPFLCIRSILPHLLKQGSGSIINVSSIAAFMASPRNTTYCATKAYLNLFSQGLQDELTGTGVRVQALCPGLTHTEFHDRPGYEDYETKIPEFLWMKAEDVVRESLAALEKGRVICIPGFRNRLIVAVMRNRLGALMMKMLSARFQKL